MFSVDTFEGHDKRDLESKYEGKHTTGFFSETSFDSVRTYFSQFTFIEVIKGRIQDSVNYLTKNSFGFIYLDMDIYSPTIFSLNYFSDKLIPGGIILLDDYNFKTCPGINKAVAELVKANSDFVKIPLQTGQCMLIKL